MRKGKSQKKEEGLIKGPRDEKRERLGGRGKGKHTESRRPKKVQLGTGVEGKDCRRGRNYSKTRWGTREG